MHNEQRRKVLLRRRKSLEEDLFTAEEQWEETIDEVIRNRINRRIERLEKKIDEIDNELNNPGSMHSTLDFNALRMRQKQRLMDIDFTVPFKYFSRIKESVVAETSGTAMFMLDNYVMMKADLYFQRIVSSLRADYFVREYTCRFMPFDSITSHKLLQDLAQHIGISSALPEDIVEATQLVVKELCNPLRSGHVLLLNIVIEAKTPKLLIDWLLNTFLPELARHLDQIAQQYRWVHAFAFIMLKDTIDTEHEIQAYCCHPDNYEPHVIDLVIHIPLDVWKLQDVEKWLYTKSELTNFEFPPEHIEKLASALFEDDHIRTWDICQELERYLEEIVNDLELEQQRNGLYEETAL